MKYGTSRHPKLLALADTLELSRREVIGLLELLWEFTAEYAPAGDIGKHSDKDIAIAVDWKGNPGELLCSLIKHRWLDQCDTNRLVIHDWKEHCPEYIRKRLQRKKMPFASANVCRSADNGCLPCLTMPCPTMPCPTHSGVIGDTVQADVATRFSDKNNGDAATLADIAQDVLSQASRNSGKVPLLTPVEGDNR